MAYLIPNPSLCTITHQIHGFNITRHKSKFASTCSNGSFSWYLQNRRLYYDVSNGLMRIALRFKCLLDLMITSTLRKSDEFTKTFSFVVLKRASSCSPSSQFASGWETTFQILRTTFNVGINSTSRPRAELDTKQFFNGVKLIFYSNFSFSQTAYVI